MKKKGVLKGTGKEGVKPETVNKYIAAAPEEVQATLEELRNAIKVAAPNAEEVISYQIPTYKYHGSLVHFAVFKNHCSFIVVNKSILETFKSELKGYSTTGATIHFTADHPLPDSLVKKIVKKRIKENEAREKNRKQ
jgi:uncharacterized protein YdhG (YjbR/CyaY superfamily)